MSNIDCEIRREWTPVADLCGIERTAAARYREAGYDQSAWPETSPEEFGGYASWGLLWVAVMDGAAVGFALVDVYGADFHLEEIDVLPSVQGRGVGARLIAAVIEEARGRAMSAVTLRTFRTTPWSVGLYRKLGFEEWRPRPMPAHLRALAAEEASAGLTLSERVSMRLDLRYTSAAPV